MIGGAMSSAGVGPLCFLKTSVTAPVYREILEHFMLPCADQLFKDVDFIFQQDLAPVHTAISTRSWLNHHGVGVLDWPANSPDLNIENLGFIGLMKYSNLLRSTRSELVGFCLMWAKTFPRHSNLLRCTCIMREIDRTSVISVDLTTCGVV